MHHLSEMIRGPKCQQKGKTNITIAIILTTITAWSEELLT